MPRNNTGNPLPSSSPLDREDNSLILEELINSKDKDFVPDRFGEPLHTWHKIQKGIEEQLIAGGKIFPDEAAGRAIAEDDAYYLSEGDSEGVATVLWQRISADTSRRVVDNPSVEFVYQSFDEVFDGSPIQGEFYVDEKGAGLSPLHRITDVSGNVLAQWGADGYQLSQSRGEFYTDDKRSIGYSLTGADGNSLISTDAEGFLNTPWRGEFYTSPSQIAYATVDKNGKPLSAWNANGELISAVKNTSVELSPYITDTQWRATNDDDYLIADIDSGSLLSTYQRTDQTVSAVLNGASLGSTTLVAGGTETGLVVPASRQMMHVVLCIGQSLSTGGRSQNSLISTTPEYPNFALMFDSGPASDVRMGPAITSDVLDPSKLTGFTPIIAVADGLEGQTPMESCVNKLLDYVSDTLSGDTPYPYLAINAGRSGTAYSGLKKGTQTYANMLLALNRAKELSEAAGYKLVVDACLHKHGEADALSATYYDDLIEWQSDIDADVKAITGQQKSVPFIMAQPSGWVTDTPRAVLAMLKAHEDSPDHWLSGADYPYGDNYDIDRDDFTHFTGPGYFLIGEKFSHAWRGVHFHTSPRWDVTRIKSAERTGAVVTLTYSCPVPPLVFDTSLITERDFKGFRYVVDGTDATVADATITSDGTSGDAIIELTLSATPSGSVEEVYYALTPHEDPRTVATQPRGNVRDSAPDVSGFDGRPLYNWGVHQSINVTVN